MNTPRYAKGSSQCPIHLASIHSSDSTSGHLVFVGATGGKHTLPFTSHTELTRLLNRLMLARVPFAVGGMCPGPADEVALLIANAELSGPYLELSWAGPQQWLVREMPNSCDQWQATTDVSEIANLVFDPLSLQSTCPNRSA